MSKIIQIVRRSLCHCAFFEQDKNIMESESLQPYIDYIISHENLIPKSLYGIYDEAVTLMAILAVALILWYGWRKGLRRTALLLLIEYVTLLYGLSVFFRPELPERQLELIPFWSYSKEELQIEKIMNIIAFIPVGALLCIAFRQTRCKLMLLGGFGLSLSIEILQYILVRGCTEIDDLMHNTLGCVIGMLSAKALGKVIQLRSA